MPDWGLTFDSENRISSTATVTNATGTTIEEHVEYGAYGEALAGGNGPNRYLFSGKERDAGGEDYFGARYYAFRQGRFLTPDWSATPQPVPYAQLGSPQTLNLYAYVQNNPITGTDPDGHFQANQFTIRSQTSGISMEFETSDVAEIWGPEEVPIEVSTYLLGGERAVLISKVTMSDSVWIAYAKSNFFMEAVQDFTTNPAHIGDRYVNYELRDRSTGAIVSGSTVAELLNGKPAPYGKKPFDDAGTSYNDWLSSNVSETTTTVQSFIAFRGDPKTNWNIPRAFPIKILQASRQIKIPHQPSLEDLVSSQTIVKYPNRLVTIDGKASPEKLRP